METGEKIRELRRENKLTQAELGEKVGVKKAAIQKYESGAVKNIKRDTIFALAQALHTTPAHLMGWSDRHGTLTPAIYEQPGKLAILAVGEDVIAYDSLRDEDKRELLHYLEEAQLAQLVIDVLNLPKSASDEIQQFFDFIRFKYNRGGPL